MGQEGIWGWTGSLWVKVLVDSSGHLQIDALSTTLPPGAATYGMQNLGNQYIDLIRILLTARLPTLLDSGALKIKEQSPPADPSTGGRQDVQTDVMSLTRILLNARLPAALDGLSLKVKEQSPLTGLATSTLQGDIITALGFGGNVYSKTMTMSDNNATRFETTAKKLRDVIIIVKTYGMLLGETGVEVYPVGANEAIGFTKVDISTLYFKNAGANENGVITILGVEE